MLKGFSLSAARSDVAIKSNYHTHNYLCGHAGGSVADYVREAVANGMDAIGISDHCLPPINTYDPYISPKSMETKYLPQFDEAERIYGGKIRIFRGAEIEYFSGFDGYYRRLTDKLDYLVLGQHLYKCGNTVLNSFIDGTDDKNVTAYFESVTEAIKSGFFSVIAHPDLIFYCRPRITPKMAEAFETTVVCAVSHGIALELNANGIRYHDFRYPTDMLIELCKKYDARVVVSSDAHDPKYLCDEYTRALYAYALDNGLNVVNKLF